MSKRIPSILAAMFTVIAAGAIGWGVQQRQRAIAFDQKRIALLQSEVDRLRASLEAKQREKEAPRLASKRAEIERAVEDIRGLKFLRPVKYDMLTRDGIKDTLRKKLSEQMSDDDFHHMALGLAAFGLIPPGYPLKEKYVDLLGEQVAAFYDQHTHTLYMFEDASLESAQNRVVLAHELTHALQDQHFSLKKLPLEIKDNDDRAFAASALVEGEATLVMTDYLLRDLSWRTVRDSVAGMVMQNMDQLQTAPQYLQQMLVFPYLRGQDFCLALQGQDGYRGITEAYQNPPASTAQILHPELFMGERVDPIAIKWTDLEVNGTSPSADNVLGEMGVRLYIEQWDSAETAEGAAAGWAGDRYVVYGSETGWNLLWKTLWRTPQDAAEFEAALRRCLRKRYSGSSTRVTCIERGKGNAIRLIDAADSEWADALKDKLL